MRVDHVIPYIGDQSSGPSQSVPNLCNELSRCGVTVELHTLEPLPADNWLFVKNGYPWRAFPYRPLGFSPQMLKVLCKRAKTIDILHNNSLWMMPNIYPGIAVNNTNCKLVTAPRGTMTEYAMKRSSWKKAIILKVGQKATLARTDMFHATSDAELADIRRLEWKQPVAVVPNGISIPKIKKNASYIPEKRVLLFFSRIHPDKNVDMLLNVWQSLETRFPSWELWICGPLNNNYAQLMIEYARKLNLHHVLFKGEILGDEKWDIFAKSDLFVLPAAGENFGIAVAEALSCGTPAVVTRGAPWSGLEQHRCGWWPDTKKEALHSALVNAMSLSANELKAMGERGIKWMEQDFGWDMLAEKMLSAYEWLLYGGKIPDCVYVS